MKKPGNFKNKTKQLSELDKKLITGFSVIPFILIIVILDSNSSEIALLMGFYYSFIFRFVYKLTIHGSSLKHFYLAFVVVSIVATAYFYFTGVPFENIYHFETSNARRLGFDDAYFISLLIFSFTLTSHLISRILPVKL